MTTAQEVAQYMLDRLNETKYLYQEQVVWEIKKKFGDDFVYTNANGNFAIAKPVLKVFRQLTGENVIWERGERMWRKRVGYDKSGRQQD